MNAPPPLTEDRRKELLARLATEPSDTKLSNEFGISRKTIWRMRQSLKDPTAPAPPSESQVMRKVVVPDEPKAEAPMPPSEPVVAPPAASSVPPPAVVASPVIPKEDVRPKVDTTPVHLSTYFAVQLLRGESYKDVANAVLTAADAKGVLFYKLQVLDITVVGATAFVRFRADMPDAFAVVRNMTTRGIIVMLGGTYIVQFPGGKQGKYPTSTMCSAPKVGFGQVYAGTKIKRWKHQFAA